MVTTLIIFTLLMPLRYFTLLMMLLCKARHFAILLLYFDAFAISMPPFSPFSLRFIGCFHYAMPLLMQRARHFADDAAISAFSPLTLTLFCALFCHAIIRRHFRDAISPPCFRYAYYLRLLPTDDLLMPLLAMPCCHCRHCFHAATIFACLFHFIYVIIYGFMLRHAATLFFRFAIFA
jgi:hypothetical protein